MPPVSVIPPVVANYVPQGAVFTIGDLPVYETKSNGSDKVIISAYDIFGFHPIPQQFADKLALAGYRVAIPDFFRGEPYKVEDFPPKERSELIKMLTKKGSWKRTVKADLMAVVNHYKETEGISCFGIYGMGWGARVTRNALVEFPDFKVAAFIHPSFWKIEDAFQMIQKPLLLVVSQDEDDMIPYYNVLKDRLGEDNCAHFRFDDIHHGFAGARGDLSDELNRRRVDETLALVSKFFSKYMRTNLSRL